MLINGVATTQISALDRGLQYGDGLFETIASINGQLPLWEHHVYRLTEGCKKLRIIPPDLQLLKHESLHVSRNTGPKNIVKIIITRGEGGRGYQPLHNSANRIVVAHLWPDYKTTIDEAVAVRWCDTRLGHNPILAGVKHLNRLEQVMASSEWSDGHIVEGLMRDQQGYVIEGTKTNIFIVNDGCLITPLINQCGVNGIIRQLILNDLIGHGLPVKEQRLTVDEISNADELFVCNSVIGLWPVAKIEDTLHPVSYRKHDICHHIGTALHTYMQY